jgi:hypothetical protein
MPAPPQIGSGYGYMTPVLRELIGLSLLAGVGLGLALVRGDLVFAAVFGIATAMLIIEAVRHSR